MKEIKAPSFVDSTLPTVFLAGSIDMGAAENWQMRAAGLLILRGWTVLNPRREDWDNTWEQRIDNEKFNEQVNWELQHLESCTKALVYFANGSQSPITLLELGLLAQMNPEKVVVVCGDDFYRKGNVDIVCKRYNVQQAQNIEEAAQWIGRP